MPTLVIGGGPDSHVPQPLLIELVDRMPTATMVTIAAGHDVHANQPDAFLAVRSFLTDHPCPDPTPRYDDLRATCPPIPPRADLLAALAGRR